MSDPHRVVAVIPARGGSKGVPQKNLKRIGGIPIVGRSALAAKAADRIDAVYVSSDDEAILDTGARYGASPIPRPDELSGDAATSEDAILHAIEHITDRGSAPEVIVFLQCTSPFTLPAHIDALVAALDDKRFNAALTVSEDHGFLWSRDVEGRGRGVNHNETKQRQRRQDLPPQYRENGAAYAFRTDAFLREGQRFCAPVALVETDMPAVEIDTPADLEICQAIAMSQGPITEHLAALSKTKLLITDFDGVHTDDRVIVLQDGTEGVVCSRSDGMGMERLKKAGLQVMIISKETNPVVAARAAKLGVDVFHGQEDKKSLIDRLLVEKGLSWEEVAFFGNDINDVPSMETAGLAIAPADAHHSALAVAHWITDARGGNGAIREVADLYVAQSAST